MICIVFCSSAIYSQTTTIKGKIIDQDTLMILFGSINKYDTVFTYNGEFERKVETNNPELFNFALIKNKQSIQAIKEGNERKMRSREDLVSRSFFLEGGEITFSCTFLSKI